MPRDAGLAEVVGSTAVAGVDLVAADLEAVTAALAGADSVAVIAVLEVAILGAVIAVLGAAILVVGILVAVIEILMVVILAVGILVAVTVTLAAIMGLTDSVELVVIGMGTGEAIIRRRRLTRIRRRRIMVGNLPITGRDFRRIWGWLTIRTSMRRASIM